ncbi:MAG: IS21 family transposase [Pseudobdellovibrionaceae bacterium]
MARERLAMRDIKEIFRLRFGLKLSQREVAKICGCGKSTVQEYEKRAFTAGLTELVQIEELPVEELRKKLGENLDAITAVQNLEMPERALPNWAEIREELVKDKNVTLMLLWTEYKQAHPEGYQYTQFCEHYRRWKKTHLGLSMRQEHVAGEKTFVDYAGSKMNIIDASTGEVKEANIFVGVLGASSYTYAEATWTQNVCDWISSHVRMFDYFGGASSIIVPDNLASGIKKSNRYEAKVNSSYQEMAQHYGSCVIPARVKKPKDKAKAEVAVQVVQRWILAALRKKTFFSLEELNQNIFQLVDQINLRKMKAYGKSRRDLFLEFDRPSLQKLPTNKFEYGQWKLATVNIDYHVSFEKNFYSVPHDLTQKKVEIRATDKAIEIFFNLKRVASHKRSYLENRYITNSDHRPKAHQAMAEWTPDRMIKWAEESGESVSEFAKQMISRRMHPEQSYRSLLGVLRLGDKYGKARLNKACERSLSVKSISYQTVKNILERGMDQLKLKNEKDEQINMFSEHENVRGPDYYH